MLTVVTSVVFTGCSTEWEEMDVCNEQISYTKGELPCEISVGMDQVTIYFHERRTGSIILNGNYIGDFKDVSEYTIRNLKPNGVYMVQINCMNDGNVLSKTIEFTTIIPFVTQIGMHELDPFNYDEKELDVVYPYPAGGFVDDTYNYVRRIDADGHVMWRTAMQVIDLAVSDEGGIAVLTNGDYASRITPETGNVLYKCHPTDKDISVESVYPCRNGGMVLVGQKWIHHSEFEGPNEEYYYFGLFDANGNVIHEDLGNEATDLYKVIEKKGGGFVAIGKKGGQTIAFVTFDAKGNKVSSDSEYSEYRDLNYTFNVQEVKRDKDGSMYFLVNEEIERAPSYCRALVVKVDYNGKIVWTRPLVGNMGSCVNTMYILEDNRLCVVYGQDNSQSYHTVIVTMTKDNEILRGDNLGVAIPPISMFPLNDECTEFKFYDGAGRILHVDVNAPRNNVPFVLREGW